MGYFEGGEEEGRWGAGGVYRGLEKEILRDWEAVWRVAIPVYNAILPGTPLEELRSEVDSEGTRVEDEVEDDRSESSCLFVTGRDEDVDSEEPDSLKHI